MRILHLTDLHFSIVRQGQAESEKWKQVLEEVEEACRGHKIDRIAITGDLTCHGTEEEFKEAFLFFLELVQRLKMERKQVLFCPGNHDADGERAHSEFHHYEAFIRNFYENDVPDVYIKHRKRNRETGEKLKFSFLSENTCTETSLMFFDQAVMTQQLLDHMQQLSYDEYGILLMHHQPEVIKNQDFFGKIVDDGRIKLILCGHLHPTETRIYRAGKAVIVNGMAITPHLDFLPSGFQIVHIKASGKIKNKSFYIKLTN